MTREEKVWTLALWGFALWLCVTISWFYYTYLPHMLDDQAFLSFRGGGSKGHPALYRMLVPLLFQLLPSGVRQLKTGLNPPLQDTAAIFQIGLAAVSLFLAFVFFHQSVACKAVFPDRYRILGVVISWMLFFYVICFNYVIVPNRALRRAVSGPTRPEHRAAAQSAVLVRVPGVPVGGRGGEV